MEFLLDSVILIDHLNDIPEATAYLGEAEGKAVISVVTRAEVLTGYDTDSREEAEFLDEFPLLEITRPIADLTASLRREHGWKLPDAFQAALANHHDLKLVTRNTRDFSPQRHDFVVVSYTLGSER
ncbi:MAG: PIN domain-containing protein [Rubrobacteraceae bacterium]|nr:PIN domain-containing protein [Rubrobacteraceae bacterium]